MSIIKEHPTNTFSWRFILLHYVIGYVLAVIAGVLLSIITTILGFPLGGVAYVVIVLYGAGAYLAYRYIKTYDAYPSKRLGWKISAATSPVTIIFSVIFFLLGTEEAPQLQTNFDEVGILFWIAILILLFLTHLIVVKLSLSSVARQFIKRAEKQAKETA